MNMVIIMICKNCGKNIPSGKVICPYCGKSLQSITFTTNRMGEDGHRGEYVTEKYNMTKGVFNGKNNETKNNTVLGILIICIIVLIIVVIAAINYLM